MAINFLLALHFGLAIAFDAIPDDLRATISAVLLVGYSMLAGQAISQKSARRLILCITALALVWAYSFLAPSHGPPPSTEYAARGLLPLISGVAIVFHRHQMSSGLLKCIGFVGATYALYVALSNPEILYGGRYRPFPFASGVHTSAYLVGLIGILVWEIRQKALIDRVIALTTVAICAYLLIEYEVRTAQVLVAAYFAVKLALHASVEWRMSISKLAISLGFVFSAGIGFYVLSLDQGVIDGFSSGRVANYLERLDILAQRGLSGFFLGSGPGTDFIVTQVWSWEAKDSHSDILKSLWEGGAVGLAVTAVYFFMLAKLDYRAALPIVVAMLSSSLISNAMLSRPNAAFIGMCILALALRKADEQRRAPESAFAAAATPSRGQALRT